MVDSPHRLWSAKVFHRRLFPRENSFSYRVFYTLLNSPHQIRHINKDHGKRDGSSALVWAADIFRRKKIEVENIQLLTIPRIMGYFFCPVSFWLGWRENQLYGVICEVNNTFKQTHSYVCYHSTLHPITANMRFTAKKEFHVSPFFPRAGEYYFRFDLPANQRQWRISIDYFHEGRRELSTALWGEIKPITHLNMAYEYFRCPFITIKVIFLIHYQALKLWFKKAGFHRLPPLHTHSLTDALEEN